MVVPNALQQRWKQYGDACEQWGLANPFQTKGKPKGGGKGDAKGGKSKGDDAKGGPGKGAPAPKWGAAPQGGGWPQGGGKPTGGKPNTDHGKGKTDGKGGGKGGKGGKKGKSGRSRSQTGAYFGNADQYYDENNTGDQQQQQAQVQQGIWIGSQYMVPANIQTQGQHTQVQQDGTEWTELDNANVEALNRTQEESHPGKIQEVGEHPQGWAQDWFADDE